jgi:predicted rRNA methylase YqxC with S4 and FtsJ domains
MLRRGVLKNNKMRREIIINFEAWLKEKGFFIVAKKDNEVAGRFGNVERFYYLRLAK